MSSNLSREQKFELFEFLSQPAYESVGCAYDELCELLKKYDSSIIGRKLGNSFIIDSNGLGLEIFGCQVGTVMVNPDAQYMSQSDWYGMPLWGYVIDSLGVAGIKKKQNDKRYLFLDGLQDIFSDVGTAKDSRWNQDKINTALELKQKLIILKKLLLPIVFLDIYLFSKPQWELDPISSTENGIFKIFDDVYRYSKRSKDEDLFQ